MSAPPRPLLTAEWRDLAILNYEIDPAALRPFVPRGTELDTYAGRTLASIVGFLFLDTRVLGAPVPFHRNFEEVNLRFYVRRRAETEERRGVVFVRELVPRRAIAWLARRLYGERYVSVAMSHVRSETPVRRLEYRWGSGKTAGRIEIRPRGEAAVPAEGGETQFVCEHYWGYTHRGRRATLEYRVEHPAWRVWSADASFEGDVARLYGPAFVPYLRGQPSSAFLAEGSRVRVHRGHALLD